MLQKQHNTQTTTDQQLWTKQEIEPLPFFIEGGGLWRATESTNMPKPRTRQLVAATTTNLQTIASTNNKTQPKTQS